MADIYMDTTFTSVTKLVKIWIVLKKRGIFTKHQLQPDERRDALCTWIFLAELIQISCEMS